MEIPIANIFYLLCYAWDVLEEKPTVTEVDPIDSTDLLDLFGRVLVNGTRRLLRRGLDRGYLLRQDEIPAVRGKLLITQTLRRYSLACGRATCAWDELEYDTLPNRILKTTLLSLRGSKGISTRTRADVSDMLRWLEPVTAIKLRREHFRRIQLHRNNRIYILLLHVCEFIHEHGLPTEGGSQKHFRDFVRDRLWKVFQEFVYNFYQHHLPAGWNVSRFFINWQMVDANEDAEMLVPRMETDVCLRNVGRAIILDTKFYAQSLKNGNYGSHKLDPSNLYQLFAYLRQRANVTGWEQAEGVLLFPRSTRDFSIRFTTHGHLIRALTLDLTQPWQNIHNCLMRIAESGDIGVQSVGTT